MADVAVVLAGGRGSRMRRPDGGVTLTVEQSAAAASGYKCLVPDSRGRPFLDHILHSLVSAGIVEVVLVVGPDHDAFTDYLTARLDPTPAIRLAVQEEPLGTANALLAAAPIVGGRPFLVMNSDNLYPVAAIRELALVEGCGLVAFDREGLLSSGKIPAERVMAFALIGLDDRDTLTRLVEKPDRDTLANAGSDTHVSMNLWRGDSRLIEACKTVPRSERGEFELPAAVLRSASEGIEFKAIHSSLEVLDLSHQSDIEQVAVALGERELS